MNNRRFKATLAATFFALLLLPNLTWASDPELDTFIEEITAFSKEIAAKIESDPTSAGFEAAQKILDSKNESLRERIKQFRKKETDANSDGLRKLMVCVINGSKRLTDAFAKNAAAQAENPDSFLQFQFLMNGFIETFYKGRMDDAIESFIADFDAVSKEMAVKIKNKQTSAGIDDAQKAFDAKKGALKQKFGTFKNARGMQVSEATLKKLTDSITNNGKAITDAFSKHADDYADEPEAVAKFQKLMKDYTDTFAM